MKTALVIAFLVVSGMLLLSGGSPGDTAAGCVRCHEMTASTSEWRVSSHRNIDCKTCHGGTLQASNVMKAAMHFGDDVPEQIRMKHANVTVMVERCKDCHQQQFADWQTGPHGSSFKKIFTDAKHNANRPLMDDCLRCHGMHFKGGIRELVNTTERKGPWSLKHPELENQPAIPCLSCHAMHTKSAKGMKVRSTLALYDRRDQQHVLAASLPVPAMLDGERPVKMSPDARQSLCFQCHASLSTMLVGSGDDRTPKGVHEGISCLACHDKHSQNAAASCATCHPKMSNCGLDVEKMDTTFANKNSRFNIHWVKCEDCHQGKRPVKKLAVTAQR